MTDNAPKGPPESPVRFSHRMKVVWDEKKFILKHLHSLVLLFIFLVNSLADRLFLKYVHFQDLAGAESGLGFDFFEFNWNQVNHVLLVFNLIAVTGILCSFAVKQVYWKFWPFFVPIFCANLFYPSGMWLLHLPRFHFVPVSIILMNGYGLLMLLFLRKKKSGAQTVDPPPGNPHG